MGSSKIFAIFSTNSHFRIRHLSSLCSPYIVVINTDLPAMRCSFWNIRSWPKHVSDRNIGSKWIRLTFIPMINIQRNDFLITYQNSVVSYTFPAILPQQASHIQIRIIIFSSGVALLENL